MNKEGIKYAGHTKEKHMQNILLERRKARDKDTEARLEIYRFKRRKSREKIMISIF